MPIPCFISEHSEPVQHSWRDRLQFLKAQALLRPVVRRGRELVNFATAPDTWRSPT